MRNPAGNRRTQDFELSDNVSRSNHSCPAMFATCLDLFRMLLVVVLALVHGPALAETDASAPADLRLFNRPVVTLRVPLAGLSPAARVERARVRFSTLSAGDLASEVSMLPMVLGEQQGLTLMIGKYPLFTLLEADLDPEERIELAQAGAQAESRLREVIEARRQQQEPGIIARGVLITAAALLVLVVAVVLALKLHDRFNRLCERHSPEHPDGSTVPAHLSTYLRLVIYRLAATAVWLIVLAATYAATTTALEAFPWTEPYGIRLAQFISDLGGWLVAGAMGAIPGLVTITIVVLIARAIQDALNLLFRHIQTGRIRVPMLHADTIGATRRLFAVLVWGLALAIAYPFLPGSGSEAFKGLSVLFGLMLTLGSTGLVTQLMGGLVVVYSRSLKRGDFIAVNGIEGVVSEVGALAVKVVNMRNEEITLPNSVITGSPIHNYSKLAGQQGTLVSTQVTIGYDVPWRQVHALLNAAALKTRGVRQAPAPFVYQRALSDFYVTYELFAHIDRPLERVQILSALHAAIQDEFNTYGVQIMSPNFLSQPPQTIVVPPEKWYEAPAQRPDT